jgi:hypothetical protein
MFERDLTRKSMSLRSFKLFVVICGVLKLFAATHTARLWEPPSIQIICGALKLFAKEHCDSRVASAHSNYLRHAQIICCRSHCTAAESLFVQIICKALTLFEAAPPCVRPGSPRSLHSVLRQCSAFRRPPVSVPVSE